MVALPTATLWGLVGIAVVWDVVRRRIPNALVLTGLLMGLSFQTQVDGFVGLGLGLLGAGVALAILIVPFYFRMMGGGDVKLAVMCGAFVGARTVVELILVGTVLHGVLAVAWLVWVAVEKKRGRQVDARRGLPHAVGFGVATVLVTSDLVHLF